MQLGRGGAHRWATAALGVCCAAALGACIDVDGMSNGGRALDGRPDPYPDPGPGIVLPDPEPADVPDDTPDPAEAGDGDGDGDFAPCCDCSAIILSSGLIASCPQLLGTAEAWCENVYNDDGEPDFDLIGGCGACDPTWFSPPAGAENCMSDCDQWPNVCVAFCGSNAVAPATYTGSGCACSDDVTPQLVAECPDWTCWGLPGGVGESCVPGGDGHYTCEFPGTQSCDGSLQCSTCEGDWDAVVDYGDGTRCQCACEAPDAGVGGGVRCSLVE